MAYLTPGLPAPDRTHPFFKGENKILVTIQKIERTSNQGERDKIRLTADECTRV